MWTFVKHKFNKMIQPIRLIYCCLLLIAFQSIGACQQIEKNKEVSSSNTTKTPMPIVLGNEQLSAYLHLLENKKVGFVGNHTSQIGSIHLVDSLLKLGIQIKRVFSPEHGFRGVADAGEKVKSGIDARTNLPVISLYGDNKKPKVSQIQDLDILLFDIQDVGLRFYTYISTLHYVMEAAAEAGITVVVLDRPNPNGHFVDGPILEEKYKSFVGLHPIPVVHGMTIGEYAKMINEEKWLNNASQCELIVVPCLNYSRDLRYDPPIPPSPNLPNARAIYLYPTLCFFEGTSISVGRGTDFPFQQIGAPKLKGFEHSFTPQASFGAKSPKYEGEKCFGINFSKTAAEEFRNQAKLDLTHLIAFYDASSKDEKFFNNFFNLLAGNASLQAAIKAGKTEEEIRASWQEGLEEFKAMQKKYLLYKDL